MKNILFALFTVLLFSACHGQKSDPNAYIIQGVSIAGDGQTVVLRDGDKQLASTTVRNSQFTFRGVADSEPLWAQVWIDDRNSTKVFLEPGQILVNLDVQRVAGTPLNDSLDVYSQKVYALVQASKAHSANQDSLTQAFRDLMRSTAAANQGNAIGRILSNDLELLPE